MPQERKEPNVKRRPYIRLVGVLYQLALSLGVALLAVLLLLGGFLWAYQARYQETILPGVAILDVPVGGLTRAQALARLEQELAGRGWLYLELHTAENRWVISAQDMGGSLDLPGAVAQAWRLGRSGIYRHDLITRAKLLWWGYSLVPTFHLEPGPALMVLQQIARQVNHPARRAQLQVAGLQAFGGAAELGRELDLAATRELIVQKVSKTLGTSGWGKAPRLLRLWHQGAEFHAPLAPLSIPLQFRELAPPLSEVAGAQERAQTLLRAPLTLTFTFQDTESDGRLRAYTRRWTVDQAVLSSWLTLQPARLGEAATVQAGLDEAKIAAYVQALAEEIARPPREARFAYDPATAKLTVVAPGQIGYNLDVAAAQQMVMQACFGPQREIALPVRVIPPRVTRADLEALLPLSLISEGESSFQGSSPERLRNIRLATAQFHGLAVPPQTTFSFLQHLGLVTVANGYSESWVISGDRTVLGPGGGVCQVSTTCFRAAFWGGYPLVERSPHSYRVSWYEPPLGLDAAVFSPIVDFKFRNDTDTPILILTEVDEKKAKLYFRFYGRPTGRRVTLEGPVTANPVPAGPAILEEDPSLAPGQRVQVEWPHDGLDVTLYRIIEKDGVVVARDKIFSRYEPWPARFRVGPAKSATSAEGS